MTAPFSISDVLAWARTKPAGERYRFPNNGGCAIAQYLKDSGKAVLPNVSETIWEELSDHSGARLLPVGLNAAAKALPHDFGSFVSRLEALTEPAEFTVADVLAWARTKPADQEYDYVDPGNCALCQFLKDTGRAKSPRVTSEGWREGFAPDRCAYPSSLEPALMGLDEGERTTFGGLVRRLEKLCPETPVTRSDWLKIDAYLNDIEQVDA